MSGDHQESEKEGERESEKEGEREKVKVLVGRGIKVSPYLRPFLVTHIFSLFSCSSQPLSFSLSLSYWEILSNFHEDQNGDRDQQAADEINLPHRYQKGSQFLFQFLF